jgi:hypothetical protein
MLLEQIAYIFGRPIWKDNIKVDFTKMGCVD